MIGKSWGINSPNFSIYRRSTAFIPRRTCISNLINEAARPDFRIAHSRGTMEGKKLQKRDVPSDLKPAVSYPFRNPFYPAFVPSPRLLHPGRVSLSFSVRRWFSPSISRRHHRSLALARGGERSGHGKVQRVETKGSAALEILEQWRPNNGQLLEIQLTMKSALFERTTFQRARFIEFSSVPLVKLITSELTNAF